MQRECRKAYRNYMFKTTCDPYQAGRKKKLFRHAKSLHSDHCGVGTLCKDGICVFDNQAKADLLNNQFSSVFTIDDGSSLPNMGTSMTHDSESRSQEEVIIRETKISRSLSDLQKVLIC